MLKQEVEALHLPPELGGEGILVGYSLEDEHPKIPFGFAFGDHNYTPKNGYLDPYLFQDEGHLLTIAPTGAGKGVSCVIPTLLRYPGDVVVMDPKGENYAVTAMHRREMGQQIVLIDPFGQVDVERSGVVPDHRSVNVFSLLPFLASTETAAAESLAAMLIRSDYESKDQFWEISATNIFAGLIDHYAYDRVDGTLDSLFKDLVRYADDTNEIFDFEATFATEALRDQRLSVIADNMGTSTTDLIDAFRFTCPFKTYKYFEQKKVSEWQSNDSTDVDVTYSFATNAHEVVKFSNELERDFAERLLKAHSNGKRFDTNDFYDQVVELSRIEVAKKDFETLLDIFRNALSAADRQKHRADKLKNDLESQTDEKKLLPVAVVNMMMSDRPLPQRITSMILATPDRTWGSMLSVMQNNLGYLNDDTVRACISESSFDLNTLRDAKGSSLYIVIPPHRLQTASTLPATLFKGIINVLSSRRESVEKRTLFLMDEVAQLGHMRELVAAKTLLRGYGVQVWSFWQDLSQLQSLYPDAWPTLINNCKVIQAFGCATPLMAAGLENLFDVPRTDILDLEPDEMILSVYGDDIVTARLPKYFSDPAFEGLFSENHLAKKGSKKTICTEPIQPQKEEPAKPSFSVERKASKRYRADTSDSAKTAMKKLRNKRTDA